jgi:hypothetical protein
MHEATTQNTTLTQAYVLASLLFSEQTWGGPCPLPPRWPGAMLGGGNGMLGPPGGGQPCEDGIAPAMPGPSMPMFEINGGGCCRGYS